MKDFEGFPWLFECDKNELWRDIEKTLTIDTWGASAPGDRIFKEYGFTVENASQLYKSL
mgnify:CR=1 FL=1